MPSIYLVHIWFWVCTSFESFGFIRNRNSARERYRRSCLLPGQTAKPEHKICKTLFIEIKGVKILMLITFTSQVMVVWPLILRYFVEKNIISLIVVVVYLVVCASTFYIYLCIYNYATFNIEIVSIAVHNYTYAYVKAMKEVVLSQDIGSEESLRQLKKLRKDWEWHLEINKQRDDNKVTCAFVIAMVISFALGTAITIQRCVDRTMVEPYHKVRLQEYCGIFNYVASCITEVCGKHFQIFGIILRRIRKSYKRNIVRRSYCSKRL